MSRIRLYHCNKCGKYGLTPGSKGSNKYKCRYYKTEVDSKDVNTHEWKDGDGDIITKDGIKSLDGEMENTLMNTIAIQENAKDIEAAKAKGVKFGAQPMVRPPNYPEKLAQWQRGEISAREAARQIGVTHKTFLKWAKST